MTKLLRVWRVAELLDCSKRFIYTLIETGQLDVVRLGPRGIRIKSESLQKYLQKVKLLSQ